MTKDTVQEVAEEIASRLDGRTVTSHEHYRELLARELTQALTQAEQRGTEKERDRLFNADTLKLGDHYLSEEGIRELIDYKLKKQQ